MGSVAILIPTKNRHEFLVRQLAFYSLLGSKSPVYVLDSSEDELPDFASKAIAKFSSDFPISYERNANLNDREAIGVLLKKCREHFCAFNGDDDFLIPSGLESAAKFLGQNPDFRVAHGQSRIFDSRNIDSKSGRVVGVGDYWKAPDFSDSNLLLRLEKYSHNYFVPLFSVHRTSEFTRDWDKNEKNPSRSFGEVMPNFITISRGKAKFLNIPYLVRQTHEKRGLLRKTHEKEAIPPHGFVDLLLSDGYVAGLELAVQELSQSLIDQGINSIDASMHSKKFLDNYLKHAHGEKCQNFNFKRLVTRLIKKYLPHAVIRWLRLRFQLPLFFPGGKAIFFSCKEAALIDAALMRSLTLPLDDISSSMM